MKLKKMVCYGLVFSMVVLMTGCSGSGTGDTTSDNEKETLTILIDGSTEGTDGGLITENIEGFEEKYNVEVNFVETPYAELHQRLMNVAASGGDDFDVVFVETDFVAQMARAGVLEPLDSYEEESETLNFDDYIDSTIERNTVDGSVYAIPQVADVQTTIYNTDILAELGFANPPSTIEEFIDYCEKADAAGYLSLAVRYNSTALPCQLMGLFLFTDGGSFVAQDGDSWEANLDNETGQKWIENVRKIFSTIDGDTLATMDDTAMYEALNSEKAGCTIGGAWMYDALDESVRSKLITAPFPKGSGDQVALMSGWNLGIFANSKNKDLAFKFLEYKADPENAGNMTAGLSGRKDAEEYFTDAQKEYYPEFQELMQYGVAISPVEFQLRSEMTTAFLPVFQQITFSDEMTLADAAKLANDTIQKVIDDNE